MKPCLVDVNVWIALLLNGHEHHGLADRWFDNADTATAGLCRVTHLASLRLLSNRRVMGDLVLSPAAAWTLIEQLRDDERVQTVDEPRDLDRTFRALLRYPTPTPQLIMDAYLAAFAIASGMRLVTIDSGFRQFEGLDLELLTLS